MVDGLRRRLRGLLAAPVCLLCAGPSAADLICSGCRDDLPWNSPACLRCAQTLPTPPDRVCGDCLNAPPMFDRAIAALRYQGAVARAVQQLKYNADFLAARWLADALTETIRARRQALPQILIPVPLHDSRLRRRGFNQAQELAKRVGGALNVPIEPLWARRTRSTADQIGLDAAARRRNLRGAFAVDARVARLDVALLDDVMTTGSTLNELARACRRAGAASVEVWTTARA